MKFLVSFSLSLSISLLSVSCTPAAGALSQLKLALNPAVDPLGMNPDYKRKFDKLPLSGKVASEDLPWSDSNWPSNRGGIAHRWLESDDRESEAQFDYELKSYEQLSRLEAAELQKLSPAEKFDIYAGRYDYPTVKAEWQRTAPDADEAESLEHGFAPAALNFREPSAVQVSNEDGIEIDFSASDIKALLSYYQGQVAYARTVQLGERCRVEFNRSPDKACLESNAGAFHLILTNELGLRASGFVLDRKLDGETSNNPVHSFHSVIERDHILPLPNATEGTVKHIEIKTTVTYSAVSEAALDATNLTPAHSVRTISYHYMIDLDTNGLIIGGSWIGTEKPDFMWRQDRPKFEQEFSKLDTLYEHSLEK